MIKPVAILKDSLREAWDSGNLQNMSKTNPERATDAHISLVAHITAQEICRRLDDTEYANGFANRFLFVCVRRSSIVADSSSQRSSRNDRKAG